MITWRWQVFFSLSWYWRCLRSSEKKNVNCLADKVDSQLSLTVDSQAKRINWKLRDTFDNVWTFVSWPLTLRSGSSRERTRSDSPHLSQQVGSGRWTGTDRQLFLLCRVRRMAHGVKGQCLFRWLLPFRIVGFVSTGVFEQTTPAMRRRTGFLGQSCLLDVLCTSIAASRQQRSHEMFFHPTANVMYQIMYRSLLIYRCSV